MWPWGRDPEPLFIYPQSSARPWVPSGHNLIIACGTNTLILLGKFWTVELKRGWFRKTNKVMKTPSSLEPLRMRSPFPSRVPLSTGLPFLAARWS